MHEEKERYSISDRLTYRSPVKIPDPRGRSRVHSEKALS